MQDTEDEMRHCDPGSLLRMPEARPSCELYHSREGSTEQVRRGCHPCPHQSDPYRPLPQQKGITRPRVGEKRARSPSEGHHSSSPSGTHRNGSVDVAAAGPSRHVTFPASSSSSTAGPSRTGQISGQPFRPASGPVTVESILEEEALDRFGEFPRPLDHGGKKLMPRLETQRRFVPRKHL